MFRLKWLCDSFLQSHNVFSTLVRDILQFVILNTPLIIGKPSYGKIYIISVYIITVLVTL